jgi:hypothetical protein
MPVTYKEVFPLIKDTIKCGLGRTELPVVVMLTFETPFVNVYTDRSLLIPGTGYGEMLGISVGLPTLITDRRHQPLPLMTMDDNLKVQQTQRY